MSASAAVITVRPVVASMSNEQLLARIAELEAKVSKAQAPAVRGDIKIGAKGGVSVYGMGRFPVSLFYSQWVALFAKIDALKLFMFENYDKLNHKEGDSIEQLGLSSKQ